MISRYQSLRFQIQLVPLHFGGGGVGSRAHEGRVTALRCTPDGLYLVSAGTDHRLRLWDLSTGRNCHADYGEVGGRLAPAVAQTTIVWWRALPLFSTLFCSQIPVQ